MRDLYEVLGVHRLATTDRIEAVFRQRAKETHPDQGGDRAEFEQVMLAREVLGDPERRKCYDETGTLDAAKPDNARAKALAIVQQFFGHALDQISAGAGDNGIFNDVVDTMREAITQRIAQIETDIGTLEKKVERLTKFAGRFKSKGADNILRAMVDNQIEQAKRMVIDATAARDLHKAAIEILVDYEFEADKEPARELYRGLGAGQNAMGSSANPLAGNPLWSGLDGNPFGGGFGRGL
jgi:curved DNA-binding protein CbpA